MIYFAYYCIFLNPYIDFREVWKHASPEQAALGKRQKGPYM